jgi:hypothetical protein
MTADFLDVMQCGPVFQTNLLLSSAEEWRGNKGSSILKIEAAGFFETLVTFYQTP